MTNIPTNPLPFAASPNKYQTNKRPYSTSQKLKDIEGGDDRFPTPFAHKTPLKNNKMPLPKVINS